MVQAYEERLERVSTLAKF